MVQKHLYERPIVNKVLRGIEGGKKLIYIIVGPRQVGKTTAALQIGEKWPGPVVNSSADSPLPPGPEWIRQQWDMAQRKARPAGNHHGDVLLILDEVQKVKGWSETVKELWDHECRRNAGVQVLILGSSSLLIQKGMTESLTGRFFLFRCTHWSYGEMEQAFSWELDRWLFFGGYPGAAPLAEQESAWAQYIRDSLIETVLAKDVLQLQTISKPALLRHLFLLAAAHPAQILSYNKMLGQLHDAGNTTTLAHYLKLLESAFLVSGLELFKQGKLAKRGTSPKLILWNNGLVNAVVGDSFEKARADHSWWGRLIENAVGAHLRNHLQEVPYSLHYWRYREMEVDFVVKTPRQVWAVEVKSGKSSRAGGVRAFLKEYPKAKSLIIGPQGIEFDEFFRLDPKELF